MQIEVGKIVDGVVTGITKFGAFVDIGNGNTGLVHISEISDRYVNAVSEHLKNGQQVKVKILGTAENGKLNLSIRRAVENNTNRERTSNPSRRSTANESAGNFEDMLSKFMHSSDEKLSGMRKQPFNRRGVYQKKGGYDK